MRRNHKRVDVGRKNKGPVHRVKGMDGEACAQGDGSSWCERRRSDRGGRGRTAHAPRMGDFGCWMAVAPQVQRAAGDFKAEITEREEVHQKEDKGGRRCGRWRSDGAREGGR